MVIEFSVANFLSFKERRTISFKAKSISELKQNTFTENKNKLVRSIVVYGANSSGKSNLIKAFERMKSLVLSSVKLNDTDTLDYDPFLLNANSYKEPTYFEIVFYYESITYRYGFEYTLDVINSEWLFRGENEKVEELLFLRTTEGIGVADIFEEGKGKEISTNNNRLFISLVAQLGGSISKSILAFFSSYNTISGLEHEDYKAYSTQMLHEKLAGCDESLDFFKKIKLGFQSLESKERDFDPQEIPHDFPKNLRTKIIKEFSGKKLVELLANHHKFDEKGKIVDSISWDRKKFESDGTNKIIDLSGPIFDSLKNGKLLIVDELDAKLHPLITLSIIKLFHSRVTNPNNAQLLFVTHDTNLLSSDVFRRDQIWFAEKDEIEQTDLYSLYAINLLDGSKVRNDVNYERNYIRGRYGAIPFITN
jgi:hypothetical protein